MLIVIFDFIIFFQSTEGGTYILETWFFLYTYVSFHLYLNCFNTSQKEQLCCSYGKTKVPVHTCSLRVQRSK